MTFKAGDKVFDVDAPDVFGIVTKIDNDSFTEQTRVWAKWESVPGMFEELWIPLENARRVVDTVDVANAILVLTNAGYRVTIEKV